MDVQEIIDALHLKPHPKEGGYFVETYRSEERLNGGTLMGRYSGSRAVSTAIYYLLTPDSYSEMHRLQSDELFHFYLGDPVEMLQLWPDGEGRAVKLGGRHHRRHAPAVDGAARSVAGGSARQRRPVRSARHNGGTRFRVHRLRERHQGRTAATLP